jgi:hypothetical protein
MHLSWVTPFGPPGFILTSRYGTASLLLPRDQRVVEGESAEDILGALTGISLAPSDLQAILTGCVVPEPRPVEGRGYGNEWAAIDLAGGTTLYLRRAGDWRLRVARRDDWLIEYLAWQGAFPRSIRLSSDGWAGVEMTATISQLEANTDIDPAAFVTPVPPEARPLTLAELREAGLLGAQE